MHERCGVPAHKDLLQAAAGMEGPDRHRAEEVIEAQSMSAPCCELMQENFTYFLKTGFLQALCQCVRLFSPHHFFRHTHLSSLQIMLCWGQQVDDLKKI